MSEALYERYKDALRRGHVAALRGRTDAALDAYGEAARLAPDRALPLVGIGTVLAKLGKHGEALTAFDSALERAPADEAALRGRADALTAGGDRVGAAATLDRVAAVLDSANRRSDALDAARRALELAESRSRRATVRTMVAKLTAEASDPAVAAALSLALGVLDGRVGTEPQAGGQGSPTRDADVAGADDVATRSAEPEPAPEPAPPPFDPAEAFAAFEAAAAGDDPEVTRQLALVATVGHRAAGQPHAAIDVCYGALATSPADPGLHLALAEVYLDYGWRAAAADKLSLLARLAELADDDATRQQVCAIAAARLPDEPRLASICA
jgi:tetratricopeptide (TPR) repeat protein